MNKKSPFQLLMPSFNQAHYIGDAVRSVLAQSDPCWELWIVDNSTDDTPEVMRGFTDSRIRFHHIPERMDPGSCLNWMLERAGGEYFSYVHTDNNLDAAYVQRMRMALEGSPLGLAYCDMRTIDDKGDFLGVFRRGEFDLPRMLSIDTLGVPFAATKELARRAGGFSVADFADDVRFCVGAFGLAQYIYVRQPLVDYRLHAGSRTEEAGGSPEMVRVFARLMPKIVRELEGRGVRPLQAIEQAIKDSLDDLDIAFEDQWYRHVSKHSSPWWRGRPRIDHFFFAGLLSVPGFSTKLGRPPRGHVIRDESGRIMVYPWTKRTLRHQLRRRRDDRPFERLRNMLPVWAPMKLGLEPAAKQALRIVGSDFRTIWVARNLELSLGWQPLWDASVQNPPVWLKWGRASGQEPVLDCSDELHLGQRP